MRIAIFTDSFTPIVDGVVITTLDLAKGLANLGHKVYIIAPKYKKTKEFSYKNIKVIRQKSIKAGFYQGYKFTSPFSLDLLRYLKRQKIDIIHFQTPITIGFQGILLSKILRVPLVGTFHTLFTDPEYIKHLKIPPVFLEKISWEYAKTYYNRCDLITCPSEEIRKELIRHGFKQPIKFISNGINPKLFNNSKSKQIKKKYSKKGNLLLFVGRIAYEKNIPYLLDCFKLALKKVPGTKLLIVGSGPQFEEIKEEIKRRDLEKEVILTGRIEHDKLVKSSIYGACDLFVTASKTETQGITTLEAQANGIPCVGINERGIKDLVKNNYNGYLVKFGDKKEFAAKIVKVLSNKKLYQRLKKNTLKEIEKHKLERVISTWEETYQNLIKKIK